MCGIAGIWNRNGGVVESSAILRFVSALAHRGPDGQAAVSADEGRLALAHRRLAILDTTPAAAQPMRSASGRYDMIYNGEVYNFLELRAELEHLGHRFRSAGDSEVVLAAWEQWGAECLLRFNGMWSLAIWDRSERVLVLSRDRFGVKPLYFTTDRTRIAFASELKAFLALDGFTPRANNAAIEARLAGNFSDHVLLEGMESLPPGHNLHVDRQRIRLSRWWNTLDHIEDAPMQAADRADRFRELLMDACRLRLRADVPVASSLSGGLDSASVAASIAAGPATRSRPCRQAYIAAFPGTDQDESSYGMIAAHSAGMVPVLREISVDAFRESIDTYLYQFEEIGGLFGAAAWMLYREMRRDGVIVSLEGHGGDELLGGYVLHVVLALMRSGGLLAAPRRVLELIDVLRQMDAELAPGYATAMALIAAVSLPGLARLVRMLPGKGRRDRVFGEAFRRHGADPGASGSPCDEAETRRIDDLGPLTSVLYRSFHRESLPRILRNFDAHSMGHGVEVRMPFLDWRLVCHAFSLPDQDKVAAGYTKRILREAMRGMVPDAVRLRREKLGYNAPLPRWFATGLRDWLREILNDSAFLRSDQWDGHALRAMAMRNWRDGGRWRPDEVSRLNLAVTAHHWQTTWMRQRPAIPSSTRANHRNTAPRPN